MLALSVRQPWAWLIIHGGKDIENRDWPTKVRGRVLIHAAKGMTRDGYDQATLAVWARWPDMASKIPTPHDIERGGIVGSVEITDCVIASTSPWFFGRCGFVLRDPVALSFVPYRGMLGFFEVPLCAGCGAAVAASPGPIPGTVQHRCPCGRTSTEAAR